MCRALAYLGQPVLLDSLLYQPDSALVKQSFMPKMLHLLNLAGFGLKAWDQAGARVVRHALEDAHDVLELARLDAGEQRDAADDGLIHPLVPSRPAARTAACPSRS